jgi:hypothetical protein
MLTSAIVWENYIPTNNDLKWVKIHMDRIKRGILPKLRSKNIVQSCSLPKSENTEGTNENSTVQNTVQNGILPITALQNGVLFVDTASEDRDIAENFIKTSLETQGIKSTVLKHQKDPTKMFKDLENKLKSCNTVVMFYDKAPLSWLKGRLRQYQVIQFQRNDPMSIVVYSSHPKPKEVRLPKNASWKKM